MSVSAIVRSISVASRDELFDCCSPSPLSPSQRASGGWLLHCPPQSPVARALTDGGGKDIVELMAGYCATVAVECVDVTLPAAPPLLLDTADDKVSDGSSGEYVPVPVSPVHGRRTPLTALSVYEQQHSRAAEQSAASYDDTDDEELSSTRHYSASSSSSSSVLPLTLSLSDSLSFTTSQQSDSSFPSLSSSSLCPCRARVHSAAVDDVCVSLPTAVPLGAACVSAPCPPATAGLVRPSLTQSARRGTLFLSRRRSEKSIALDGPAPPAQPTHPTSQLWHSHRLSCTEQHHSAELASTHSSTLPLAPSNQSTSASSTCSLPSSLSFPSSRRSRRSLASFCCSQLPVHGTAGTPSSTDSSHTVRRVSSSPLSDTADIPPASLSLSRRSSESDLVWESDSDLSAPTLIAAGSLTHRSCSVVLSPSCPRPSDRSHRARRRAPLRISWSSLQIGASVTCESDAEYDGKHNRSLASLMELPATPPLLSSVCRAQTVPLSATHSPSTSCHPSAAIDNNTTQPFSPVHHRSQVSANARITTHSTASGDVGIDNTQWMRKPPRPQLLV